MKQCWADLRRSLAADVEPVTFVQGYPNAEENKVDQTIAAQVKLIEDTLAPVLRTAKPPK